MIRRPPRSTRVRSSAASDVYKRQVLNMRERICALEPRDDRILLTTLRTHEDILPASDAGGIDQLPKPDRLMLEIAEKIIDQHEGRFDPSTFKDRYEDAVRDLIAVS